MKQSNEIIGLPIVSISEGIKTGIVQGTIIDPQTKEVAALLVEDEEWYKGAKIVPFTAIRSIGADALIIDRNDQITAASSNSEIEELINRAIKIINTQIITTSGKNIGEASEYIVDQETGKIVSVEIIAAEGLPTSIEVNRILTFGRDVMIVSEEGEEAIQTDIETQEAAAQTEIETEEAPMEAEDVPYTSTPTFEEVKKEDEDVSAPHLTEEESAGTAESAPAEAEKPSEEAAKKTLEERQHDFLIGKTMRKDVTTDDGTVIIKEGETVNEEVIQKAKENNKYLELTFSIKRS